MKYIKNIKLLKAIRGSKYFSSLLKFNITKRYQILYDLGCYSRFLKEYKSIHYIFTKDLNKKYSKILDFYNNHEIFKEQKYFFKKLDFEFADGINIIFYTGDNNKNSVELNRVIFYENYSDLITPQGMFDFYKKYYVSNPILNSNFCINISFLDSNICSFTFCEDILGSSFPCFLNEKSKSLYSNKDYIELTPQSDIDFHKKSKIPSDKELEDLWIYFEDWLEKVPNTESNRKDWELLKKVNNFFNFLQRKPNFDSFFFRSPLEWSNYSEKERENLIEKEFDFVKKIELEEDRYESAWKWLNSQKKIDYSDYSDYNNLEEYESLFYKYLVSFLDKVRKEKDFSTFLEYYWIFYVINFQLNFLYFNTNFLKDLINLLEEEWNK